MCQSSSAATKRRYCATTTILALVSCFHHATGLVPSSSPLRFSEARWCIISSTKSNAGRSGVSLYSTIGTEDGYINGRCSNRPQGKKRRRLLLSLQQRRNDSSISSSLSSKKQQEEYSSSSSSSQEEMASSQASSETLLGDNGSSNLRIPSYKELIAFVATTILIWISEPLLSLVDTGVVGMTSSAKTAVVQLAALGPATTVYDSAIYMTYFLAIAATNQLAPGLAQKDWKGLRKQTSHLMGLGLVFGVLVMGVVFGFGTQMMTSMAGHLTNAEIIPLATNYAKIRAAVAPFCVVDFVAQSFCLTTLDTVTPAIAVAVASIVNIVGDLLLAPKFGIQGAAIATALATVSSCLILTNKVRKTTNEWKQYQEEQEENQKANTITTVVDGTVEFRRSSSVPSSSFTDEKGEVPDDTKNREIAAKEENDNNLVQQPSVTPKKMKSSHSNDIPFFSLPDKKSVVDLVMLAGPIFFIMMSKIACYSIMTMRATNFGIIPLAAHNIMMRVFFFFSCSGDSISQAAQTFFPQVKKRDEGQLLRRLLYLAAAIGLCISNLSTTILGKFGSYLTKDASIIACMSTYAPWVGFAVFLHPFLMLVEGYIMAKRDFVFLVGMYVATTALHFGFTFSSISSSFLGLWRAFFVFQAIRLVQLTGRLFQKSRSDKILNTAKEGVDVVGI